MNKLNQEQPEYINISSLDDARNNADLSVVAHSELIPLSHHGRGAAAIGPDAWYNDDFDYDKAQHTFGDDPLLKQHFGQLLDMRSTIQGNTYLDTSVVEMEHKPVLNQRSKTWHGDKFAELQMFEKTKNERPVLLKVSTDSDLKPRLLSKTSTSKEPWSPTKAIDEIRKVKEAPPKNVVQDRRKKFEAEQNLNMSEIDQALDEAQREIEEKQKKHQEIVKDFALSDSNRDSSDDPSEPVAKDKKRSVSELLNDFEKKSKEFQEEEIKDRSGSRRRVFSDTETMMYDTSSDEESSSFEPIAQKSLSGIQDAASRKSSLPTLLPSASLSLTEDTYLPMVKTTPPVDEQPYLAMSTPDKRSSDDERKPSISSDISERRPSQSMIMEHLVKEFGAEKAASILENFETTSHNPLGGRKAVNSTSGIEGHNYCEIPEQPSQASAGHYEYLFKASSSSVNDVMMLDSSPSKSNYESVYHEIPESAQPGLMMEKILPDIIGNAPTGKHTSSDDAEEELIATSSKERSLFEVSGTFTPASFYLDNKSDSNTPSKTESLGSRELPEPPIAEQQKQPPQVPFKNSFLKKEINLTYQSVYENEDISSSSSGCGGKEDNQPPKVPYYVSDIKDTTTPIITNKKRRAQTPDAFLSENSVPQMNQDGVMRSKSLEGLLGDGHAGARDSIQVSMHQYNTSSIASPLPARGHDPPPPPPGVPPLDLSQIWQQQPQQQQQQTRSNSSNNSHDDDASWRESLRRASAKHQQYPSSRPAAAAVVSSNTPPTNQLPINAGPHINGYIWDQRDQRFYRLNADPNPNPRLFKQQPPFLDQGLPTHTNFEDQQQQRIKVLMTQRPMSVGPLGSHGSKMEGGMMGRPSSTLPISAHQIPFHAPQQNLVAAPSQHFSSTTG